MEMNTYLPTILVAGKIEVAVLTSYIDTMSDEERHAAQELAIHMDPQTMATRLLERHSLHPPVPIVVGDIISLDALAWPDNLKREQPAFDSHKFLLWLYRHELNLIVYQRKFVSGNMIELPCLLVRSERHYVSISTVQNAVSGNWSDLR